MPSLTTRLCLIRHGETDWNAEKRIQGQIDIPLNAVGAAQARAAARGVAEHPIRAIYSSDLGRAHETARAAARALDLQVTLDPALRERHYGMFQGLTYSEASERFPSEFARFSTRDGDYDFGHGESLRTLGLRVRQFMDEIVMKHVGHTVLLVTHGGVLDIAYRMATGKQMSEPRDFVIPNAALNWIAHRCGKYSLLSWGERAHLGVALDELPH